MSFYNDATSGNYLSHADITDARFQYNQAWTVLAFIKAVSTTLDDTGIVCKRNGNNQFIWRIDNGAAPTLYTGGHWLHFMESKHRRFPPVKHMVLTERLL